MSTSKILQPKKNCWRIEYSDSVRFLIDGAEYFHAFRETAKNAERSILIIGWDIDSRFKLEREDPTDGLPNNLSEFLGELVHRKKQLHIHVLNWDFAMIYAADREWLPMYKMGWTSHHRLHFQLDNHHPAGASHHQKIVVIDDRVAFVGGLDFTFGRWDTQEHQPNDQRRQDRNNHIPQPYHDVQIMVSGAAAQALGDLARSRWHAATKHNLERTLIANSHNPWPIEITRDITGVNVGIARTYPKHNNQEEIREVERLLEDAIAAAHSTIYIENQYFTAQKIGDALVKRLSEENAPEIVTVLPLQTDGWLTQITMDVLRERLLKRLYAADHRNRLRAYYPQVPGLGSQCVNVHSKILVIDDELVIVGSANFNNRSMGLDTECDLAIEAQGNAEINQAISNFRSRLLAEHLSVSPSAFSETLFQKKSLILAIEAKSQNERTLKPLPFRVSTELDALIPDAQIADPEQPMDESYFTRNFFPEEDKPHLRRTLTILASILIGLLLIAAAWRWTPLSEWIDIRGWFTGLSHLRGNWLAPVIVSIIYIIGGLIVFPVTLMIVATGLAFGAMYGFFYSLLGTELSAIVTYAFGHYLGHKPIRKISHRWVNRVNRRLSRQGLLAIVILRIVPVAPFSVINLLAGASHIRFKDFALGTLLGIAPGIFALTLLSDQIATAIQSPEAIQLAILLALAAAIGTGIWALRKWVLRQQNNKKSTAKLK